MRSFSPPEIQRLCERSRFLAAAISAFALLSQAQSPPASSGFEVASVKSNDRGGGTFVQAHQGRLVMTNFSLRRLVLFAYGVQDHQLSGDPSWIGSEHYHIEANAEGNTSVRQMEGPMLQALLEDRFQLRLHRETRQLPVFELTIAKSGVKMPRSKEGSCIPYSKDSPPPSPAASGEPRPDFCGFPRITVNGLNRTLDGIGVSMAVLATNLSRTYTSDLRRNVLDGTGLTGTFDVHLTWTTDTSAAEGVSLFTALEEQLGLKLRSTKGPVEVLVIDHVEKPSAN